MQIVAFDYGTKKIGVAVGQTETYTSSPLQIIYNDHEKTNWNEIRTVSYTHLTLPTTPYV